MPSWGGVRGLNDWLAREYDTMIGAVNRSAELAAENSIASGGRMTHQAIAAEQDALAEFGSILGQGMTSRNELPQKESSTEISSRCNDRSRNLHPTR